jgi:hypothetical protein
MSLIFKLAVVSAVACLGVLSAIVVFISVGYHLKPGEGEMLMLFWAGLCLSVGVGVFTYMVKGPRTVCNRKGLNHWKIVIN